MYHADFDLSLFTNAYLHQPMLHRAPLVEDQLSIIDIQRYTGLLISTYLCAHSICIYMYMYMYIAVGILDHKNTVDSGNSCYDTFTTKKFHIYDTGRTPQLDLGD